MCAGSALTTFYKGVRSLAPKVIAHRSSATRGEMLVNTRAYREFRHKARLNDNVRAPLDGPDGPLLQCRVLHHLSFPIQHSWWA